MSYCWPALRQATGFRWQSWRGVSSSTTASPSRSSPSPTSPSRRTSSPAASRPRPSPPPCSPPWIWTTSPRTTSSRCSSSWSVAQSRTSGPFSAASAPQPGRSRRSFQTSSAPRRCSSLASLAFRATSFSPPTSTGLPWSDASWSCTTACLPASTAISQGMSSLPRACRCTARSSPSYSVTPTVWISSDF
nr:flocculation protein FLO11-like [Lolium perenne]